MAQIKLPATKANLIKAQDQLGLMNQGYDILDKKRKALLQQYNLKIDERNKVNEEVNKTIKSVYKVIKKAIISVGEESLKEVAGSIPEDDSLSLEQISFMQTTLYKISMKEKKLSLSYSFYSTNVLFDQALIALNDLKKKVYRLAELDTTINNLNKEMKKTSKKVNSLDKVQIPKYNDLIKEISSQIEEREREEFSKTKMVKDRKLKEEN
ncbi:MAG: V-type ATP synthase subunit D [Peptoniphilaceae bacterium]|nr:V-type ATP synthase subunit D [Peptoniphilaceae bacterium]MDY6018936.1 V-type ATP synthase subunit D [Anaerococcus sp.]